MKPRLICCAAMAMLAFAAVSRSQGTDDTIKVDTRLVSVPVIVSDHDGRYVPNLQQSDFKVLQDGNEQQIAFFGAAEEPVTVAILIDTSQSTHAVLGDIKDSAKSFVKLLQPKDRAMVVTFDYDVHILSPLTSDQDQLKDAIKHAQIPDRLVGTMLRDAVYQTVSKSFQGINGRKAIIVLTDGKDAGSYIRTPDLLYRLEESDTMVYTVMFKTVERMPNRGFGRGGVLGGGGFPGGRGGRFPGGGGGRFPGGGRPGGNFPGGRDRRDPQQRQEREKEQNAEAADLLKDLSDTTAGRFFSSKDGKLKKTFAEILEELRFQYRLGFYPPDDEHAGVHQIRVKVDRENIVVRARSSYRSQAK
ncbi:MAG: VWA domain-containing protein [Acidobacteria bacterium]|nr:VWA domain-containing protein [Acidobacteriota bacterium]